MSPMPHIPPLGDERGFSLIELLVAMASATVVVTAALAIYIVALHQSTRISDREQADQTGRTAMTHIVEELHSSCLQKEFTPVQAESTGTELRFRDAASGAATISSSKAKPEAYEDRILWKKESSLEGTLIDERYPVESGTLPKEFKYNTTTPSAKVVLATNVSQTVKEAKTLPIFTYSEYAEKASSGSETTGVSALEPIKLKEGEKLTTASAAEVAAVEVNFTVAAREANAFQSHEAIPFSNEVVLAFGLPASEAKIEEKPCQ
jgi:prepilin-type N-terminal cleavage/methylation domain-containing protein